jgi:hypothetical protein
MDADPLFQLIKSLTKNEKTYFRKWVAGFTPDRSPGYMQLFDAILERDDPDEQVLRKTFSSGRSAAHYATLKQYLYDKLLDALHQYQKDQHLPDKAEAFKREAELLIRRELHGPGLERLNKARKLGYKLEYYSFLIDVLRLENHTLGLFKLNEGVARKKAINQEIRQLLHYLEQEQFYFEIYDQLFTYGRKEPALRHPEELEQITRQLQEKELSDPDILHSLRSKHLYYGIHITYHTLIGDYEQAYRFNKEILAIWAQYPLLKKARLKQYLLLYMNYLNRCYLLKKVPEFRAGIEQLRAVRASDAGLRHFIQVRLALFALLYHEMSGDFDDFETTRHMAGEALALSQRSEITTEQRLILYNLAYQLFLQSRYSDALDACLAFEQLGAKTDIQDYLRRSNQLLKLLLHFELGDYQLLENTWRNHYQQLQKTGQLFAFEELFILMIRDFARVAHEYRPQLDYEHYIKAFTELKADPQEGKTFEYLDVVSWLRARAVNRAMRDVIYG